VDEKPGVQAAVWGKMFQKFEAELAGQKLSRQKLARNLIRRGDKL
jgi:hypothetical protein